MKKFKNLLGVATALAMGISGISVFAMPTDEFDNGMAKGINYFNRGMYYEAKDEFQWFCDANWGAMNPCQQQYALDYLDGTKANIQKWEQYIQRWKSFTYGYTLAEFSKYNSPASQNGLGDTPIYINCVITKTEIMKAGDFQMILGYLKDDGGNQWLAMLNATIFDNESTFSDLIGKDLIFCGMYSGYSNVVSMPVIELTQLCVKDTGNIITGLAALIK